MQEKEVFLKKIYKFINFFYSVTLIFIVTTSYALETNQNIKGYLLEHFSEISAFSSSFIQTNGITIEEGKLYLKNKRLRIEYTNPSNILIIVTKNKGMYFNKDLEEIEYFNPQNSIANIFFRVFYDHSFFDNAKYVNQQKTLMITKKIYLDNEEIKMKVFFEKSPLVIRKLEMESINGTTTYSIINPNFNPSLENKFFSLANPLLS